MQATLPGIDLAPPPRQARCLICDAPIRLTPTIVVGMEEWRCPCCGASGVVRRAPAAPARG